jgi:hypothetical protein
MGTIVAPLRISIQSAGLPDPMQVMSLRKKDPNADGCFHELDSVRRSRVYVVEEDSINGDPENYRAWSPLDKSGHGLFAASAYKNQLLNAKDLQEEKEKEQRIAQNDAILLAKLGHISVDIVEKDEIVTINGMAWRHRLIAHYDTADPAHAKQGKLTSWDEIYEHNLDDTHVLRRSAWYGAMVIADPEWIAARRNLLLKLVQAVRIESMTQAEVDDAVKQYQQQREQDRQAWESKH